MLTMRHLTVLYTITLPDYKMKPSHRFNTVLLSIYYLCRTSICSVLVECITNEAALLQPQLTWICCEAMAACITASPNLSSDISKVF